MKKIWCLLGCAAGLATVAALVRRKKPKQDTDISASGEGYLCEMPTEEVVKHNTLMNGITSTRGEAMGFLQRNRLILEDDSHFTLKKELKTTKTNLLMKEPVRVCYTFRGTYTGSGTTLRLSEALSGEGTVDWGTFSKFLDTGNGTYNSETSPGILSLYPTAFFVENCKNVPMTVYIDEKTGTFTFEAFEPTILSPEEAGAIRQQTVSLDPDAGLMREVPGEGAGAPALKDSFSRWGMKIGTCINASYLEEPYLGLLKKHFSSVTLENGLKPGMILSHQRSKETGCVTVEFSPETRQLLDWCRGNGMPLRGHTLIWYMGTPEWLFHEGFETDAPNVTREEMLKRMEDLIRGFFEALEAGGWSEFMYCIDVVNEAIIAPDTLRKCLWLDIIGPDYIHCAYRFARQYAPGHIRLCYNDFDLEMKTDKIISLVNSLKEDDGSPLVDIVGQQGHYGAYSNIDALGPALKKIALETGCELQVTELDVSVSRQGTQDELKRQGRFYHRFVQQLLALRSENINVSGLTLWGYADSLSWTPSGYAHIFDRKLNPKYAFYGLLGEKRYAGFDDDEEGERPSVYRDLEFSLPEQPDRFVRLRSDGSYTDTTTGAEITGTYVFDGISTYMLTPRMGGYANLTVSPEETTAQRTEAAGFKVDLIRAAQR